MARSPTEALTLTNEDREAVDILEKFELTRRYQRAGWLSVRFMENEIEFSEVDVSMGRS